MIERPQDRVVLDGRGDGVISLLEHAVDDDVQGIGRVVREAKAVGIRSIEELGEHFPRSVNEVSRLHA